ncbi:MAG: TetR/AcrR family transcriptional regulator [Actinomycetota bacterium]|nr:TetR/AcrR family transcriptional regulator [Actinomycetota bacterium]
MANRAAQRAMTRQLLLDAAMDRFVASGYAATTIDEIASAAGTTRVTFYAYFPSKSEVIKALIAERLEDELIELRSPRGSSLGGLADAVAAGTREQLGAWIRQAVARWPAVRPIVTVARAAQAVDPDLTHIVDAWTDETIEDVSVGLDKADRFDADSRRLRGALAVGQLDYLFQRWADGFWGVEQDRMCELVTESWFQLLGE